MEPSIVIGRGFAGLSLAFALLRRGRPVTVIGPNHPPAFASRAAVGVSSQQGQFRPLSPLFAAKLRGHRGLRSWLTSIEETSGMTIPKLEQLTIEPFFSQASYLKRSERLYHENFRGLYHCQEFTYVDLENYFRQKMLRPPPWIRRPLGAFFYPDDFWFDPQSCLTALESAIIKLGGRFISGQVSAAIPKGNRFWRVRINDENQGGNIAMLETSHLVLATGDRTSALLTEMGYPPLPLIGCAGETVTSSIPSPKPEDPPFPGIGGINSPWPSTWVVRQEKFNIVSIDSTLIFGSSSYEHPLTPFNENENLSDQGVPDLTEKAAALLSVNHPFRIKRGVRVRFKNRHPAIGNLAQPGHPPLWISCGYYKNGLQLSWLFAENLAEMITGSIQYQSFDAHFNIRSQIGSITN